MIGVMLRHSNAVALESISAVGWQPVDNPFACEKVLIWNPEAAIDLAALVPVMAWLDTWEAVTPFCPYARLASAVGSAAERTATAAVLPTLLIPIFDSRVVLLQRCARSRKLMESWLKEMTSDGEDDLAFLRAIAYAKPRIMPLPNGVWVR